MDDVDPHFSTQTKARKAALDVLFQADMRDLDISETLAEQQAIAEPPLREFTVAIVHGVADHQRAIDQRISASCAGGWTLERMPRVDRALARIAMFEIDYTDTPTAVIISEIVELASWLSTEQSPAFLHGVLGHAASTRG